MDIDRAHRRCELFSPDLLKKNPFILAPMAGITDKPFRTFMKELGASVVISELVSATGLKHSSDRTKKLMEFSEEQRPVGIQLFGETLEDLKYAAQFVEDQGADFVDLNFGCPVPKVVKKGAGAALLKDLNKFGQVLSAVKSSVKIPVTIKVRTGWDMESRNTHEVAAIAYNEGMNWVAIHGRTRAQGYSGLSDWDYISEVKSQSKLPIIGNGDITSAEMANLRLKESGCDGVMIGRASLKNPWIFLESMRLFTSSQKVQLDRKFLPLFARLEYLLKEFFDDRLVALQLKKLSAWYSAGYPGASQYRKTVFSLKSTDEVKKCIEDYFGPIEGLSPEDTSSEPFLMGGHG